MADDRDSLTMMVRAQAVELEVWQAAELHLLEQAFRARLAALGVPLTPDVAVALMATATLLGEAIPEWGGDARCALGRLRSWVCVFCARSGTSCGSPRRRARS